MKTLVKISTLLIASIFISASASAQQTTKQLKEAAKTAAITTNIESKNYIFKAEYAQPLRGTQKYLTPEYDLKVTQDSVIAYLPYFGQVYMSAPITPEENGIMFTCTKFDYTITPKKKGGWTIIITPANVKYVSKLLLDVYLNGTATVRVLSNFRDQITFTGYVKE